MGTEPTSNGSIHDVAAGQRLLILAIGLNIVAYVASSRIAWAIGLLIGMVALAVAIVGMLRVTSGLGYSTPRKVLYVVGLFIPLVALIVLAMVSADATKTLKANGYKVGFFGAKGV